ncbi:MAG: spore coat protein CotJB [Oscillospiraceae bacterium]|jgi:spore coat protein JB|nr:spore coat protein CotJB [Oscillospiraceae bacterium]
MSSRNADLKTLQMYEFMLHDTALFLDTHPDNAKALEYYKKYKAIYDEARSEFTRKYGPLAHRDINIDKPDSMKWQWIEGPWPWEGM